VSESWTFKPGDVFNQCKILRVLGAGLHGEVYLVEHLYKERCFALKVMRLADVGHASRVRRALSTAKATYRIQHANVIAVEDLGCEPDGRVWLLMEYLDGASVADLLGRQRGRISLRLALHIAIEAAWGIDAAHEMRIIHRDVKPENLWLTLGGAVKVLDFSLAKVIPDGVETTRRKSGFGTPLYMSPEALKGVDLDARADVYSLGILVDQMLRGHHVFAAALGDTTEMIRRQLYVSPEPLSSAVDLPAYVDDFLRCALAKDPAQRFFTMAEMAQAMLVLRDRLRDDAARGLVTIETPPGEPPIPGDRWTRAAYQPPRPAPDPDPAPPITQRRVVLATGAVELARTAPLPAGLGGTQPLGDDVRAILARAPLRPEPEPAVPPAPLASPPGAPAPLASPLGAPARRRPRSALVTLAAVLLFVTGGALAFWAFGADLRPSPRPAAPAITSAARAAPDPSAPAPPDPPAQDAPPISAEPAPPLPPAPAGAISAGARAAAAPARSAHVPRAPASTPPEEVARPPAPAEAPHRVFDVER
jgi:serine/threonine-protein kinase